MREVSQVELARMDQIELSRLRNQFHGTELDAAVSTVST
jgi:hypothetical protein